MQAVILAAGRGTRMGILTEHCPKPMLLLCGKPMLEWKLSMLPKAIDEVIIIIGYLGECIEQYFGTEWQGKKIRYVRQKTLNGTGGALHLVKDILVGSTLVMMGDDLYHPDDLMDLMQEAWAVLGLAVDNAEQFGLLEKDINGHLQRITERPHGYTTGVVNTGAYMLPQKFFEYALVSVSKTEYGLPQTLALVGQDIPVKVCTARMWQPIGRPEDIVLGEIFLKQHWNI